MPSCSSDSFSPEPSSSIDRDANNLPTAGSTMSPAGYCSWTSPTSKKVLDNRYTDMITSAMLPRQLTLPPHPPAKLTPSLSYSCSLFALFFALPSFRINHLQPLFTKHPGWGYPNASMGRTELLSSEKERRQNCSSITSFRINTCKSVSKQSTLTTFRMNTYTNRGEGGRSHYSP